MGKKSKQKKQKSQKQCRCPQLSHQVYLILLYNLAFYVRLTISFNFEDIKLCLIVITCWNNMISVGTSSKENTHTCWWMGLQNLIFVSELDV